MGLRLMYGRQVNISKWAIALWAIISVIVLTAAIIAVSAKAKTSVDRCPNQPAKLKTASGAHKRAQKGWDSKKVEKNHGAIKRVRTQSRCAPTQEGRKYVNKEIDKAKAQYRDAKHIELGGVSAAYEKFAILVHQKTGISPRVIAAWAIAENCGSINPLCIGPGYNFGSVENAAKESVQLIRSTFPSILKAKSDKAAISAILNSGWGTVCCAIWDAYGQISIR